MLNYCDGSILFCISKLLEDSSKVATSLIVPRFKLQLYLYIRGARLCIFNAATDMHGVIISLWSSSSAELLFTMHPIFYTIIILSSMVYIHLNHYGNNYFWLYLFSSYLKQYRSSLLLWISLVFLSISVSIIL